MTLQFRILFWSPKCWFLQACNDLKNDLLAAMYWGYKLNFFSSCADWGKGGVQVGVVNQEIEVSEEDTCPEKAWPDTLVQILELRITRSMQADVINDRKAS